MSQPLWQHSRRETHVRSDRCAHRLLCRIATLIRFAGSYSKPSRLFSILFSQSAYLLSSQSAYRDDLIHPVHPAGTNRS
jgi:hypothetical protein